MSEVKNKQNKEKTSKRILDRTLAGIEDLQDKFNDFEDKTIKKKIKKINKQDGKDILIFKNLKYQKELTLLSNYIECEYVLLDKTVASIFSIRGNSRTKALNLYDSYNRFVGGVHETSHFLNKATFEINIPGHQRALVKRVYNVALQKNHFEIIDTLWKINEGILDVYKIRKGTDEIGIFRFAFLGPLYAEYSIEKADRMQIIMIGLTMLLDNMLADHRHVDEPLG